MSRNSLGITRLKSENKGVTAGSFGDSFGSALGAGLAILVATQAAERRRQSERVVVVERQPETVVIERTIYRVRPNTAAEYFQYAFDRVERQLPTRELLFGKPMLLDLPDEGELIRFIDEDDRRCIAYRHDHDVVMLREQRLGLGNQVVLVATSRLALRSNGARPGHVLDIHRLINFLETLPLQAAQGRW